ADAAELAQLRAELRIARRRQDALAVGAALLIGALVWLAVSHAREWPAWVALVAAIATVGYGLKRGI
ncbi:MAG: hypothetical protein WBE65_06465, partial [Steroidobacteraceae bacterium]